jgi:hypothetical protein
METKLIEGKKYKLTFPNGRVENLTYVGFLKNDERNCDICKKDRWNSYLFVDRDPEDPNQNYFFGVECIKKVKIEEVI